MIETIASPIAQQWGKVTHPGYSYSIRSLTADQKKALTILYAFCRETHNIVAECREPAIAEIKLNFWSQEIDRVFLGTPMHPLGHALREACQRYRLDQGLFKDILNGIQMDLINTRYPSFSALSQYCHAVTRGVTSLTLEILGYQHAQTKTAVEHLRLAVHLITIIRDVGADVRRGKIYIPQEDLDQFSVPVQDIVNKRYSENFVSLMQHQATRARHFYQQGIALFPAMDCYAQRSCLILAEMYYTLLDEIEASQFQVLHQKIRLTPIRELWIAFTTHRKIKKNKFLELCLKREMIQ